VLDELSQQEITAYETIASALENLGDSEAVIRISRRGKSGGLEFCEQIPVDPAFSPQYIKENWGGGIYSVQFYGPKPGETGNKYLKQVTLRIAGAPREKKEEPEGPTRGGLSGDPAVLAMQLELATLKGMLAGLTQAKGADAGNPLDNLEKLTTIVKNMMPPTSGQLDPSAILGFAREAVGFAKEMAPEPAGEVGVWDRILDRAVEPGIEVLKEALAAQKAGVLAGTEMPMMGPGPVDPTPPTTTPGTGGPMWQVELAKIVPRLLRRAREGKDPVLAAQLFLEDAPGGVVVELERLAGDPQFVPVVLDLAERNFPEVTAVREWVREFVQAVQEELTPEPEPVPEGVPVLTVEPKAKKKKEETPA
jgi:hypothetical protein